MKHASRISAARLFERLVPQHSKLALVGCEPENGTQGAGLAGPVRADQADDPARLHGEIDAVEGDLLAVLFAKIASFYQRGHTLLILVWARPGAAEPGG